MGGAPNYTLPDEEVVGLVKRGSVNHYSVLVKRYQNRIYSVGMRFFHNKEDAADFVQEVFIKAYENINSFRGGMRITGREKFSSWLLKIAYNHGINSLKRGKKYTSLTESFEPITEDGPESRHLRKEIKEVLKKALKDLPEKYAICLDLYFFYKVSYPVISEITGFPVNTIKSHVFRAKGMLRGALKDTIAEEYHEM